MESASDKRKRLASQILEELLKTSYEETFKLCEELGIKLEELNPTSKELFKEKGVTIDLVSIRFNHHEERRIAKILKIGAEIAKSHDGNPYLASQGLKSLLKLSENPRLSHQNSVKSSKAESFSFTKPQDYISYGLEREKEKFNKSLRTMERIAMLREAAKTEADIKRQKFEQQSHIITQNRSRKSEDFQKSVENNVERRRKILNKKYENLKQVDKEMMDYGKNLERRMNKLNDWQKIEIRKKLNHKLQKFRERMEERRNRRETESRLEREYDTLAENWLQEIKGKIDKRVNDYLGLIGSRVQSARDHSMKVNSTFKNCIKIDSFNHTESLRKSVHKSLITSKKLRQKSLIASESSEKMKKTLNESFQKNRRGLSEVSMEESRRLQVINSRFTEKEKVFSVIRKGITNRYEEKKQRNFMRTERHFRNYIEKQREEVNFN